MSRDDLIPIILIPSCVIGAVFAIYYALQIKKMSILNPPPVKEDQSIKQPLMVNQDGDPEVEKSVTQKIVAISNAIAEGANAFLLREYLYMAAFVVIFSIIIVVFIGLGTAWSSGIFTAVSFITGCVTSIFAGYIGMKIAVIANSRTAINAQSGYAPAFITAFKGGCVMGFGLVSMGVIVLYILVNLVHLYWDDAVGLNTKINKRMFEAIAGYGLGGSSIALFGRVGGGIYTKCADVGADLCGKVEFDIPEDDPRNPAVIADNVGDNVGDIAGMGADLFGSFAESSCAAMVIAADSIPQGTTHALSEHWHTILFPLLIPATGIVICLLTSFVATHLILVHEQKDLEPSLKRQLLVSTVLMTPVLFLLCYCILPETFIVSEHETKYWKIFFCIAAGLWSGLIIGYTTEYYTSHAYTPTREVAYSCRTGAATNIIYGLALGYKSVIIPAFCLAGTIYMSFKFSHMYGIAMAALGILSTMSIGLTIDAYGPICDNAGGIAEMAGMGEEVRERTDALDAAGNTTAAIGKGFAIGSAALVSLALFGGFVTITKLDRNNELNVLEPFTFSGLLVGAMLPYWFSAMTMKSVGKAALSMVEEVRKQFSQHPEILRGEVDPDYAQCVAISTDASLREMIAPGCLVMLTPLIVGYLLGVKALAGILVGALVSGVQMAISSANAGGAWDNAKKYIESDCLGEGIGKGSDEHKAAVVGDTVGDPLKDTSGPSLNILIKLMAIVSLVFSSSMPHEGYIPQLFD